MIEDQPDEPPNEPPKQASAQTRPLSFFLLGNLRGRLTDVDCRADEAVRREDLHYARQAAHFHRLSDAAPDPARRPIALNIGDSSFPGALARYLLTSEPGAADFASALREIPLRAHALGDGELGMERRQLLNFIEGSEQADLVLQAANIACTSEGGAEAICDAVGTGPGGTPWRVFEHDGLEIGVISILDPEVIAEIARSRASGLEFLDPASILPKLITKMREQAGADVVVVNYHLVGGQTPTHAVELAGEIDGIDMMVTNRSLGTGEASDDDLSRNGYIVAPNTGTFIVGADSGYDRSITADMQLRRESDEDPWQIEDFSSQIHRVDDLEPHAPTSQKLRALAQHYCEDWGESLNLKLPLTQRFSRQDLQQFILNVMRFTTDSEVALVNAETFADTDLFPIEAELTLADIFAFVPYNNRMVTVEVKGEVLTNLADKLGGKLVATGLTKEGDTVRINGRSVQAERTYQVATHRYLAGGGDDILEADQIANKRIHKPEWAAEPPHIGVVVAEFVRVGTLPAGAEVTEQLAPAGNFPDLHSKFLWIYTGSINTSFNRVDVNNPLINGEAAYDQSQLNVNSTTQINLEGNGEIRADSRNHVWNNRLLVQYAQARVAADLGEENGTFEETKDLIRYRSTYQYAGFRADSSGKWYVPMPFTELQAETEFSAPGERDWHKFELTGIGGAKFQLFDPLEIRFGANARRDLNNPDAQTTYGLIAGYVLNRSPLFDLISKPIQFESELEYFYNDIGASNIHELRNTNRLYYAVLDQLFFTTTFQAFLYRTDAVGEFGSNTELTVGLNYLWDATVQSF